MNIQTTKTSALSGVHKTQAPATAAVEAKTEEAAVSAPPQETFTPKAEGESRASAAWRGGIRTGVAWGDKLEKPLTGLSAGALAIGSGIALSLGGAMVGGLVGGSFGSAVAALQADGPIGFITGTFGNMGSAISVGSTIGSVAGVAGGLMLGAKVGNSVAKTVAFAPGFAWGAVSGAINPESVPPAEQKENKAPEHKQELTGIFKAGAKVGGGVGILSGLAGGFVTGATLTAAGSLVVDVAKGDFSFSNFVSQLGTTALVGGAVGGATGAIVGGAGGEAIFGRAPQWLWDKTGGKFAANQPGIQERIDKREVELTDRQGQLETKSDNLARETSEYRQRHAETSQVLDQREDQTAADEKRVSDELKTVDTRIENNAQADFKKRSATADVSLDAKSNHPVIGERQSLDTWESKLNGWQGDLNNFRSELINWEKGLDAKIDREAASIFGEERKPIDAHFAGLHKELDGFEGKLDKYEVDINNRINDKYQSGINAEKPGVVSDLESARREKERSESELRDARSERDSAESRYNSAERSRDSARSRLRNAESEESRLRSRISSLQSRISSLEGQVRSCRSSL